MLKKMMLSGLVGCSVLLGAAGAWADIPEMPEGAVSVHLGVSMITYTTGDVFVWTDTSGSVYTRYKPDSATDGFTINPMLWQATQDEITCSMKNIDESEVDIFSTIKNERTYALVPEWVCSIDFREAFELTYISGDVFRYPSDFGGTEPVAPVCNSDDTDSDGVPDAWDQCADTPSGSATDATGCPVTAPEAETIILPIVISK
ncbi:hypothetical protein [Desulfovibrio inopinatus]|uniref:hypothetical protein n=1 Tax=Desulfovibrio inopinatus TaxID=102109 RepID=UPI000413406D|nr:hypothetical protein [Desulfovibrio inopinatus]